METGTIRTEPMQTIELDCEPFAPRPDEYLPFVLEGTRIEPVEASGKLFGNWTFDFSHVPSETWEKAKPLFKERITNLFYDGYIRYGSW